MKLFRTTLLYLWAMAAFGCGKSEYRITEPRPTLEVTALQDVYIINQPAYLQLKVSQQGYDGEFQLSAVLSEGACELSMQGSDPPDRRHMGVDVQHYGDPDAHADAGRAAAHILRGQNQRGRASPAAAS